jgi:hypothetical protein
MAAGSVLVLLYLKAGSHSLVLRKVSGYAY